MRAVVALVALLALAHAAHGLSFRNTISAGESLKFNPTFFQTATPRSTWVLLTHPYTAPNQNPAVFDRNVPFGGWLGPQRVVAVGPEVEDIDEGDLVFADYMQCTQLSIRLNQQLSGNNAGNLPGFCFLEQKDIWAIAEFGAYGANRASLAYGERFADTGRHIAQESAFNSRVLLGAGHAYGLYGGRVVYSGNGYVNALQ
jgi:hypothetical protein